MEEIKFEDKSVSMHQCGTGSQEQISLQQQMQTAQSNGSTLQSPLGSLPIQQPGATTITTMQAPPGSLAQSAGNTITTMQAPLGTMTLQGSGQTITAMQAPLGAMPIHASQCGTTTITNMSTLQHQQQHPIQAQTPQPQQGQIQQVQVIQQPLQNPTYLQQLYNTQGQLLMPGNIALHPVGMNPGSIQVITAGKTFQPNQLAPHMLQTAQGKQVITQGQPTSFPGYATIPTTTNQTLVISQLGVISSQPNILPAHSAKQDMQYMTCQTGRTNTAQPMQFSPWQFGTSLPQGIAWAPQPPTLLTTQNPIFILGTTQQDGTIPPMFIQSPPPQTIHTQHPQSITAQGTLPNLTQITASGGTTTVVGAKPRTSTENIQPKTSNNSSGISRPLSNILPAVAGNQAIRPASSVSTQTGVAQHLTQAQIQTQKAQHFFQDISTIVKDGVDLEEVEKEENTREVYLFRPMNKSICEEVDSTQACEPYTRNSIKDQSVFLPSPALLKDCTALKKYQCDVCTETFSRSRDLSKHKLTHSGIMNYQCDVCKKTFSRRYSWLRHKFIHYGIKNYQCDVCTKSFTLYQYLSRHKLTHSGIKMYQCDLCTKSFTRAAYLFQHKLVHSGIKKYHCDVCTKTFSRSSDLSKHKLTHSGIKNYQCDDCKKTFHRKYSLLRHKLIH